MNILLINICLRFDSPIKHIPVGLACIATALDKAGMKPDILDVDLYRYTDEQVESFLKTRRYDIVGLGTIVSGYKYTKNLSVLVKRAMPEALLVVGNTVASSIPELLLTRVPEVDVAVIGEGDETVVEIVRAVADKKGWQDISGIAYRNEAGTVVFTPPRKAISKLETLPFPDYSLFEIDQYLDVSNITVPEPHPIPLKELRALPLNTARGCPFDCTFCYHAFKKDSYRTYPFDLVVKQIKYLQDTYGINYIHFWDELTFVSIKKVRELCDAIERENVRFYWAMGPRGDLIKKKHLDLLKRCKDLGAISIGGALESSAPEILKAMNKRMHLEDFIEQMETARAAGLTVRTSLVFGYPQETAETIKNTLDVCRRLGIYPTSGFVLPLPSTPIYDFARARGLIGNEEKYLLRIGDRQDLHVNLTQMSDEELLDKVKNELIALKNDLRVALSDDQVIKTGIYRKAGNT